MPETAAKADRTSKITVLNLVIGLIGTGSGFLAFKQIFHPDPPPTIILPPLPKIEADPKVTEKLKALDDEIKARQNP